MLNTASTVIRTGPPVTSTGRKFERYAGMRAVPTTNQVHYASARRARKNQALSNPGLSGSATEHADRVAKCSLNNPKFRCAGL